MPSSHPLPSSCHWFSVLAAALDPRSAPRLAWLLVGAVLARGRRTVTTWIRSAGLSDEYRPCYTTVAALGGRTDRAASHLLREVVRPLAAEARRLTLALDDTPTERYGATVQGAGVHHNPTPGPAGGPFVYGHVWVVLGLLARHPSWGIVALPLLARLYVRRKDLPGIPARTRPGFRTKLELAVELVRWAASWLGHLGKPLWVVADGAYAKAPVLKPLRELGVTVVSRLRKDSALWSVPGPRAPHQRGPNRTYGDQRIELAKRAGQTRGWATGTFDLYGKPTEKKYKTFVATWRPAGGAIRVVLVDEPTGWVAFFCTDTAAPVGDILGSVASRFSLEIAFRDLKEVVGAGQQQVRLVRANVGAFHVCLWALTMTEAWAWNRDAKALAGHRAASPWDDGERRPSHADKRRAWRRELLRNEIQAVLRPGINEAELQVAAERLLDLAA
ncbi:transposase [Gemmata sp. G18]|uniref:Transposase n=1 Tax=Gemmata palustris TaxID=2822762 RepID=A0ABS5BME3_9BACT|nr:transposase [Gemmata palustris]MBP3954888.1 transposase [Gemmata palustris]MBP3957972.1 transposase [Gemmata palustris]MBP3958410.1 transposase [Gemmata palustris]